MGNSEAGGISEGKKSSLLSLYPLDVEPEGPGGLHAQIGRGSSTEPLTVPGGGTPRKEQNHL